MTTAPTIATFLKELDEKTYQIDTLAEKIEELRSENIRLKLNAVKELRSQLPSIEETFRNWFEFDDDEEVDPYTYNDEDPEEDFFEDLE